MRNAIIVSISLCVGISGISFAASRVDLDEPGAMEALARDRPAHYNKVMEEIAKAQAISVEPAPVVRDARADNPPRSKGFTTLLPSAPAKKRIALVLDGIEYRVTVLMTKDPGKLEKVK